MDCHARTTIIIPSEANGRVDETGLSKGNLSSHMTKLEDAGLIKVEMAFFDKIPRTVYELTKEGSRALDAHRETLIQALHPG